MVDGIKKIQFVWIGRTNCAKYLNTGVNFMSKKLGVKIPPGGISLNLIKNFPITFLLSEEEFTPNFLLMKLTLGLTHLQKWATQFKADSIWPRSYLPTNPNTYGSSVNNGQRKLNLVFM